MLLSEAEVKLLTEACLVYAQVKALVAEAEETDQESGANIQINKEFRDALSHVLRVIADQLINDGQKKNERDSYYEENLEKAIGHLYRAGYDAIDGVCIAIRETMNETVSFPTSIKTHVVPDFIDKVTKVTTLHEKLTSLREEKDIGAHSAEKFNECRENLKIIRVDYKKIKESIPLMADIIREEKKKSRNSIWITIGVGIATSIISIIATLLLAR